MKLSKKLLFFIIIALFALSFCVFVNPIEAEEIDLEELNSHIKISGRDSKALLSTLPTVLTREWIDLVTSASDYQEQAVTMLLRKAVRGNLRDYMLIEGPKEMAVEFVKIGYKLGKLVVTSDMSALLKEIESMTVKESLKYLGEWLVEGKAKVGMGDLNFTYESYKEKNEKHKFQYVIFYYPETANKGQGVIKIYSSKSINSPVSRGSIGSMTGVAWLAEDEAIEPFILTIKGDMKQEQIGWWKSHSLCISILGLVSQIFLLVFSQKCLNLILKKKVFLRK